MRTPVFAPILAAAVLAACSAPDAADTGVLDPVLGAVPTAPEDARDRGLEVAAYDLERFRRAGLDEAGTLLPEVVRGLVAPGAWTGGARLEVRDGKLFVVHRAEVVRDVCALLDELLARADRDIDLDVELRELPAAADPLAGGAPSREGRPLARLTFDLENGRWSRRTTRSARTHLASLEVEGNRPAARTAELVDGVVADAAIWRGPADRAVLHLLLTLRADAEPPLEVSVPPAGDAPGYVLGLPRRLGVELRGQIPLESGRWRLFARLPSPREGHALVALVRARWAPRAERDPLPGVAVLPVALPEGSDPARPEGLVLSDRAVAFPEREKWQQIVLQAQTEQSRKVANLGLAFQTSAGIDFRPNGRLLGGDVALGDLGPESASANAPPLFPPDLDEGWTAIRRSDWRAAHLAFAWDQIFVRQTDPVVRTLTEFFARLHEWRNESLPLRVEAIELDARVADRLAGGQVVPADLADALLNRAAGPPVELVLRAGTWTRVAAERESATFAGHLVPGRSTPPVAPIGDGVSLDARPRRYGDGRLEVEIAWTARRVEPGSLAPRPLAGGHVQEPRTAEHRIEGLLAVRPGETRILLGSSAGGDSIPALLVTID